MEITLQPVSESDDPFLFALYADTRASEMAVVPSDRRSETGLPRNAIHRTESLIREAIPRCPACCNLPGRRSCRSVIFGSVSGTLPHSGHNDGQDVPQSGYWLPGSCKDSAGSRASGKANHDLRGKIQSSLASVRAFRFSRCRRQRLSGAVGAPVCAFRLRRLGARIGAALSIWLTMAVYVVAPDGTTNSENRPRE